MLVTLAAWLCLAPTHAADLRQQEADISIDFRLVPDQTTQTVRAQVEQFLKASGWTLVSATPDLETRLLHPKVIKVVWSSGYRGYRTNLDTPAGHAVIAAAEAALAARGLTVKSPAAPWSRAPGRPVPPAGCRR